MDRVRNQFFGRERVLHEIISGVLAAQPASFSLLRPRLTVIWQVPNTISPS